MDMSSEELTQLLQFLGRTDIKGAEAPLFYSIVRKLQVAREQPAPKPTTQGTMF